MSQYALHHALPDRNGVNRADRYDSSLAAKENDRGDSLFVHPLKAVEGEAEQIRLYSDHGECVSVPTSISRGTVTISRRYQEEQKLEQHGANHHQLGSVDSQGCQRTNSTSHLYTRLFRIVALGYRFRLWAKKDAVNVCTAMKPFPVTSSIFSRAAAIQHIPPSYS